MAAIETAPQPGLVVAGQDCSVVVYRQDGHVAAVLTIQVDPVVLLVQPGQTDWYQDMNARRVAVSRIQHRTGSRHTRSSVGADHAGRPWHGGSADEQIAIQLHVQ